MLTQGNIQKLNLRIKMGKGSIRGIDYARQKKIAVYILSNCTMLGFQELSVRKSSLVIYKDTKP